MNSVQYLIADQWEVIHLLGKMSPECSVLLLQAACVGLLKCCYCIREVLVATSVHEDVSMWMMLLACVLTWCLLSFSSAC